MSTGSIPERRQNARQSRPSSDDWQKAHPALKRNGRQLEGPCPLCGGDDRFHVTISPPDKDGAFGCRGCQRDNPDFWQQALEAVGLWRELPDQPKPDACPGAQCESTTTYLQTLYHGHPDGRPRCVHRRPCPVGSDCDRRKCQKQHAKNLDSKHIWGGKGDELRMGCPVKLWGIDAPDRTLVVVEGEKAASAMLDYIGREAVTPVSWLGGAGKEQHAVWTAAKGRDVVTWPDNSAQGRRSMEAVHQLLREAGARSIAEIPQDLVKTLPHEGDAADVDGPTFLEWLGQASPVEAAGPEADGGEALRSVADWYRFGEWLAREKVGGRYRYVDTPGALGWWHYNGQKWQPLTENDRRLADCIARDRQALVAELREMGFASMAGRLEQDKEWSSNKGPSSDMWAGLRLAMGNAEPAPELHYLGTPDGVVDLRTGELLPHDPVYEVRGITAGRYRPDDLDYLQLVFRNRFDRVFDLPGQAAYIKLVALALTRRAQSHRALVMVVGASGSGKGDATNVAQRALGDLGMGVNPDWLAMRNRNEIDAPAAELLERQCALLKVDEVGGETVVGVNRLLTLTGNSPLSARRPHGTLIQGTIMAQIWTTAVSPPQMPTGSGVRRRLAVLPTLGTIHESEVDEAGGLDQELLDAVLTMAVHEAPACYRMGYIAPEGNTSAKREVLASMDDVTAWLDECEHDLAGMAMAEALELVHRDLGPEVTLTRFGIALRGSQRWQPKRTPRARTIAPRGPQLWADDGFDDGLTGNDGSMPLFPTPPATDYFCDELGENNGNNPSQPVNPSSATCSRCKQEYTGRLSDHLPQCPQRKGLT